MNPKKMIEVHKLPCGPMAVSIKGVCRRRLRDHFDELLDRLVQETHPEGRDPEDEDINQVELKEDTQEPEETREEKKARMLEEGELKLEVKKELEAKEKALFPEKFQKEEPQKKEEPEPSREERKKDMIDEGKLNNEVKKAVQKHADRIMPKTSNHAEGLQGNSKMLQDPTGKIRKR
jgi:hypothetical protein